MIIYIINIILLIIIGLIIGISAGFVGASAVSIVVPILFVFFQFDILDDNNLKRAFKIKPDIVFHLAAHFANQKSIENPEKDLLVNGLGTLKVLQFAHQVDVERFIYASSGSSIYGNDSPVPFTEESVSLQQCTPYQITKLLGEFYCNYFHNFYLNIIKF